jgi:hypothetical protein
MYSLLITFYTLIFMFSFYLRVSFANKDQPAVKLENLALGPYRSNGGNSVAKYVLHFSYEIEHACTLCIRLFSVPKYSGLLYQQMRKLSKY